MSLSPAQILGVGPEPGRNHFNIGIGREGAHTDYGQTLLRNGYDSPPEFAVNEAGDATVFRVLCGAKTTSTKTKYPRVELREETPNGDHAAWDGSTGTHRMVGVSRVLYLPPVKPWVCFAQIHDARSDLVRIQVEGDKVVVRNTAPGSDTETKTTVRTGYRWGDLLDWELVVVNGAGRVLLDGAEVATFPAAEGGLYFKAGCYLQTNLSIEKDAAEYGLVEILRDTFECWHTGYPSPTTGSGPGTPPVTPPAPGAPTKVIMIIRHGEKDDDGDGEDDTPHELSERGHRRAEALPPLFVEPRADLYRPDYVFASKGNTSSMRMLQTARPTADALGVGVDTRYDSENAIAETAQLLAAQANTGRVVLAVLEHSAIPGVVKALGKLLGLVPSSPKPMTDYPGDRFDLGAKFEAGPNGWVYSEFDESVIEGDTGHTPPVVPPPVETPPPADPPPGSTQTRGVGGVAAPVGAILATADSTSARTFTAPGVYDGQGHTIGRPTLKGKGITVQNYRIIAGGQYGAVLDAGDTPEDLSGKSDLTLQNCEISGIKPSGDGDLNVFSAFGNNITIQNNTIPEDFIDGDPGDSHTDFIQTWVSSSHPVAGSNWKILNNKAVGPANPSRDNSIPSIHQFVMAEGAGRGGNSGGSGKPSRWLIADNEIGDSWNQAIKLDGVTDFTITRNRFVGSSDKVIEVTDASSGVKFYADNEIGPGYGDVGVDVIPGPGPGAPAPPVEPPVVVDPPPVEEPPVTDPPVVDPPPVVEPPVVNPPPSSSTPPPEATWLVRLWRWLLSLFG